MKDPVILVGAGEMGGVFARGILKLGHPIIPVSRDMDMQAVANDYPAPLLVLVCVGEGDLHPVLEKLPAQWHSCLGLLQNELLPRDWQSYSYISPTVISVWFEKKKGQDFKVLIPSPAYGPQATLLVDALATLGIPANVVADEKELLYELIRKNVYILTTNISGLVTGGNVESLWKDHRELATTVANEVVDIQEWLTQTTCDRDKLLTGLVEGVEGDLQHMCMGRSAPGRLSRAIGFADEAGLKVVKLRDIFSEKI